METSVRRHAQTVKWSAAMWAGLIAGAIFLVLEMLLGPALGAGTAWGPPRRIAAIVLGPDVLKSATFNAGIFLVCVFVHFGLSVAYAMVLATFVRGLSTSIVTVLGIAFGALLYVLNYHLLFAVFPWFAKARGFFDLLVHAIFGVIAAYAYRALFESRARPSVRGRQRARALQRS